MSTEDPMKTFRPSPTGFTTLCIYRMNRFCILRVEKDIHRPSDLKLTLQILVLQQFPLTARKP
jgi:hypothetical protein